MSGDIVPPKGLRRPMIEVSVWGFLPGTTLWDGLDFAFGTPGRGSSRDSRRRGRRCSSPSSAGRAGRTPGTSSSPGVPVPGKRRSCPRLACFLRLRTGKTVADPRLTVGTSSPFRPCRSRMPESERKERTIGSSRWSACRARRGEGRGVVALRTGAGVLRGVAARSEGPVLRRHGSGRRGPVLGDALGTVRALAREGNTVVLAERRIPERWALAAAIRSPSALSGCTAFRFKGGNEMKGEPG